MGGKRNKGQRFLVGLLVASVLVIVALFAHGSFQQRSLEAKIAKAKAAGFPFEAEDIVPDDIPAAADNAAPRYLALEGQLKSIAFTDALNDRRAVERGIDQKTDTAEVKAASRYINECAPVLDAFVEATKLKGCYFEHDWNKGAAVLLPEYATMKNVAKLAATRAYLRLAQGDAGGVEDLAAVRRAARHMFEQPPYIALLVSLALESIMHKAVVDALPNVWQDAALCSKLRREVERIPEEWDLAHFMRTEAFFAWWCSDHLDMVAEMFTSLSVSHSGTPSAPLHLRIGAKSQTIVRGVKMKVLDLYTPVLRTYAAGENDRAVLDDLQACSLVVAGESLIVGEFISLITPVLSRVLDSLDRLRARRRCLLATFNVLEFRWERGAWPESLAEAGAEFEDPFTGEPLGYRTDGAGFRVWSVGSDAVDDDGKTAEETGRATRDEVVVFQPK